MQVAKLISSAKLMHLSAASGIPLATLWRWKEHDSIPGHASVQKVQLKRIKAGLRKLKRTSSSKRG